MENITFEDIKQLFKETDNKFKETDSKFKETDKKFQENEKRWKEIREELGGIGKSNGKITEDFFYSALENSMTVKKLKFDYIDRNVTRKRKNTQAEYDIILYNNYKVLIVEVKHNFKKRYLREFYNSIRKFKTLYPEYKNYKLYAAIAAMTFEKDIIDEAKEFGFFVLTQNNQNVQILNEKKFEPTEFK